MDRKIIADAKKVLSERKRNAEIQAERRKSIALTLPEFKEAYQDYISTMIASAKTGTGSQEIEQKKIKYKNILAKHQIVDIEPRYACPICEDTGYIDGKQCACLKKEITKILMEQSGFTNLEKFEGSNFDMFENPTLMQNLYTKMQEWCNQEKHNKNLIYICGGTGAGKTHLVKCMANELIQQGKVVNLVTAFSLNQDMIKAYSTFDIDQREQTLQKYLDVEYLFIDDLGTEIKQKGLTVNMLYLILNERKMRGLSTIITSNLDMVEIRDQYDERISSRIIDQTNSICVKIDGEDLRLKRTQPRGCR